MNRFAIASLVALSACSGGTSSPGFSSIDGNWLYTSADGSSGFAVTLDGNGTYVASTLTLTSASSANAQVETGTYTSLDGDTLNVTPAKSSCAGPDAPYSVKYVFDGPNLEFVTPSGVTIMTPNNATASTSFTLTMGCFASDGSFTPSPLAAISN